MPARPLASPRLTACLIAAALLSTGCATRPDPESFVRSLSPFTTPTPSLQARIERMRVGATRLDEARGALGAPAAQAAGDDGQQHLWWQHFEGGLAPASLLPIGNVFGTASSSVLIRTRLVFGPDLLLREVHQQRRRVDGRLEDQTAAASPAMPWSVPR